MAKYTMREMVDLHHEGGTLLYPTMVIRRKVGSDEVAERMAMASTFNKGEILGIIRGLGEQLATFMGDGCSVELDGIGVFTPSLRLREGATREQPDESGGKRNAASIEVGTVHFRVSKEWVSDVNARCRLERGERAFRLKTSPYSEAERLARALAYLDAHTTLSCREYAQLAGMSLSRASRELSAWAKDPASGITSRGQATHKVYVRRDGE